MDAAAALLERKLNVTIVEMMSDILGLQLDQKSAMAYQERFEKDGAKFLLSEKVVSVERGESGNSSVIHLASGKKIPADIIIVAAGVRPSYSYLNGTSVNVHNAVLVDDNLQTNIKDIYAAGDVTGISGIWPNAMKQGKIAALNMLGNQLIYDDRYALKNTINFFGLTTLSIGNINPEPEENCEIMLREDKDCYKKIIIKKGVIVGIILQGDIGGSGFWQYLIKNKIDLSNVEKDLFELSYSDFYSVDQNTNEYKYAI
jgi:NAD(P)H-nitrite reductase large subunit